VLLAYPSTQSVTADASAALLDWATQGSAADHPADVVTYLAVGKDQIMTLGAGIGDYPGHYQPHPGSRRGQILHPVGTDVEQLDYPAIHIDPASRSRLLPETNRWCVRREFHLPIGGHNVHGMSGEITDH